MTSNSRPNKIKLSLIERIKDRLAVFEKKSRHPNIVNSSVEYPLLIDDKALIENSTINGHVKIGAFSWIHHMTVQGGKIEIGRNTSINGPNTDIYCCLFPVIIGNFCSIARNVSIQEYNHKSNSCTSYFILHRVFGEDWTKEIDSKGPIIIGSDVWIGAQSLILSGAKIGHGAVIAANSVVSSEIPPYAIVGGSPAKVIKYRFEQKIIDRFLEIKWWEWPYDKIKQNRELFDGELTLHKLDNICV